MTSSPEPERPPPSPPASAPDRSDPERQYRLLRQVMEGRTGFHFLLVVYQGDAARDAYLARLTADLDRLAVDHLVLDLRELPDGTVLLRALMDLLAAHPERDGRRRAISVIGLERHLSYGHGGTRRTATDLLPTANFQRDAFPPRVPVPVALWGTLLAQPAIAHTAPDLWHWRVGAFDLSAMADAPRAAVVEALIPRPAEEWQHQDLKDAERRRALLEGLLDEDDTPAGDTGPAARRRSRLLDELGSLLTDLGEWDAARTQLEEALSISRRLGDERSIAVTQGRIADILQVSGKLDEALRLREGEVLPLYERLGNIRMAAITKGKIADILEARGELDEALRIRENEELPVYERLGDDRSAAVTKGKIADILQARGDLDEALRILEDKVLPVFERLGDVRSAALTKGRIADILRVRGDLDEALRIRQSEELPVYERLGDVRSAAATKGEVADILQARGEVDAALRIRQTEVLPVFERLGDTYGAAVTRWWIATILLRRNQPGDRERAKALLAQALEGLRRMRVPQAAQVEAFMRKHGMAVLPAGDVAGSS